MIHPGKAKAALMGLGARIVEGGVIFSDDGISMVDHWVQPKAGALVDRIGPRYERESLAPFDVVQGVAVIPIEGSLIHKGGWIGQSSGETSYQGLQAQIAFAERSDQIRGVVLEVDSFGGLVAGAFDTAEMMHRLSQKKPTMSILTDHAMSAAYLLASQSRQIVMPRHGYAGSIGVITIHADFSKQIEAQGVSVTILTAGAQKAAGNPYGPLDPAFAEKKLNELEGVRMSFAEAVARGRGSRMDASSVLQTEAAVFEGEEAKQIGLVDAVGNPHDAFAEFVAAVNRAT